MLDEDSGTVPTPFANRFGVPALQRAELRKPGSTQIPSNAVPYKPAPSTAMQPGNVPPRKTWGATAAPSPRPTDPTPWVSGQSHAAPTSPQERFTNRFAAPALSPIPPGQKEESLP